MYSDLVTCVLFVLLVKLVKFVKFVALVAWVKWVASVACVACALEPFVQLVALEPFVQLGVKFVPVAFGALKNGLGMQMGQTGPGGITVVGFSKPLQSATTASGSPHRVALVTSWIPFVLAAWRT